MVKRWSGSGQAVVKQWSSGGQAMVKRWSSDGQAVVEGFLVGQDGCLPFGSIACLTYRRSFISLRFIQDDVTGDLFFRITLPETCSSG